MAGPAKWEEHPASVSSASPDLPWEKWSNPIDALRLKNPYSWFPRLINSWPQPMMASSVQPGFRVRSARSFFKKEIFKRVHRCFVYLFVVFLRWLCLRFGKSLPLSMGGEYIGKPCGCYGVFPYHEFDAQPSHGNSTKKPRNSLA